jgi:hypothetical protein
LGCINHIILGLAERLFQLVWDDLLLLANQAEGLQNFKLLILIKKEEGQKYLDCFVAMLLAMTAAYSYFWCLLT